LIIYLCKSTGHEKENCGMGAIQLQAVNQECSSLKDNFNFFWLYGKQNNIGLAIGGGVYCKYF
jgi:hypothetical protein